MSARLRISAAVMLLLLSFLLFACRSTDIPVENTQTVTERSLARLENDMDIDRTAAQVLLSLLEDLGLEGEILFAYPAEDENGYIYHHIWIGDVTADVYRNTEGSIIAVLQGGIPCYGSLPDFDDQTDIPSTPTLTLALLDYSAKVTVGQSGFVDVTGIPDTEYTIKVYYASGASSAKGLEPKFADEDGNLSWKWKVSTNTKPGDYKIKIYRTTEEKDYLELPFSVVAREMIEESENIS